MPSLLSSSYVTLMTSEITRQPYTDGSQTIGTTPPTSPKPSLVRTALQTPRAAAIAGIVFSILLISSLWLLRLSVPSDPLDLREWLTTGSRRIALGLNLVPIAGVAFMWFLGVLRDRLGVMEDKLFATVFLGSGLMFLGMMFVGAAAGGGLVRAYAAAPPTTYGAPAFVYARAFSYDIMHIYAFKMAAVFMIMTSTLVIRTHFVAYWIAWLGYASAALIFIGSGVLDWVLLSFPCWVLLVSIFILVDNLRKPTTRGH
jgi:hypothetical protein